jgi:hypothetical protein
MGYLQELPAGDDQAIVLYVNDDQGSMIDAVGFTNELAKDADLRRADGWRLQSVASLPLRQAGTAGNVLFQSGGQFITQVALIALYVRQTG